MPKWGWHAIRLTAIITVVLLVLWRVDWSAILSAFRLDNLWLLVIAVLANFASVLLKGLAWKGVVDGLPSLKKKTRYLDLLSPLMVGFLFNTILAARVGEIAKVLLAKRRLNRTGEDLSTTVLLGTVVVENIITTVAWVFLVILIGLFLPLPSYAWVITAVLGVICLVVLVVAMLQRPGTQLIAQRDIDAAFRSVFIANRSSGLRPMRSIRPIATKVKITLTALMIVEVRNALLSPKPTAPQIRLE